MEALSIAPRPRRPRPSVVSLTDAAAEQVKAIMARAEKPYAGLLAIVCLGGDAQHRTHLYPAVGKTDRLCPDRPPWRHPLYFGRRRQWQDAGRPDDGHLCRDRQPPQALWRRQQRYRA